ncbi:MAG: hypothetical protein J3Q66DRAFT_368730 [Benniella sp.]|nr:MAG: hypothetical protein J3Q66DRAFT_368730 [Benniella sp.]
MSATPHPSIFEIPELVGLVAQYLSSQDIVHCTTTSKSWAHQFEPFLWRDIVLKESHPAPQALALNRHRIRSLRISINDSTNLHTLAADLPYTPCSEPSQQLRDSTSSSTATGNNVFFNLRIIRIDYGSLNYVSDWRSLCLDYVLRILNQSPGLLRLSPPYDILGDKVTSSQTESFLYAVAHKLPCIKELNIRGEGALPKVGLEFLRVCLYHPQLANLRCDFEIEELDDHLSEDFHQFNAFLSSMEDDKKAKEATGKSALGSPIKSLRLPGTIYGYPPNFVCTLLRSYLPNLELLHIPGVYVDDAEAPFPVESLRDAVAQGCPKLQHLRCSWRDEHDVDYEDAVKSIVEGCKEWGLKSFHCENLKEDWGDGESPCILETLLENHCETLEEVELVNCQEADSKNLGELFLCRNLKRVKIQQSTSDGAVIEFQHVKFGCRDLKDLQLTMAQPDMNPGTDYFGEEDEEEENEDPLPGGHLERFGRWVRRKAEEAYSEIGSLSKLESLSVGCQETDSQDPVFDHRYDLTLEHGWLRQLAGLKELKRLQMSSDFWSEMGQAEVEFMDAEWPKLEKIEFSKNTKSQVKEHHWKWLQARRPGLVYELGV